jgi:hypothetical protein
MQWLNLQTSMRTAPQFIGADPVQRATWVCLMLYAAEHETGGVIRNCADWKDRQWQQTCGVTKAEIEDACDLWTRDGADIVLWGYPIDKEQVVRAKREYAAKGGRVSGEARAKHEPEAQTKHMLHHMPKHMDERKGKERKGKEEERNIVIGESVHVSPGVQGEENRAQVTAKNEPKRKGTVAQSPPTLAEWLAYAATLNPPLPADEAENIRDFYASKGWKVGTAPMRDWHAAVRTCHRRWRQQLDPGKSRSPYSNPNSGLTEGDRRQAAAWDADPEKF